MAACYDKPAELGCSSIDSITFAPADEYGADSGSSIIEGGRGRAWADKSDGPEGKPSDFGESKRSDGNRRAEEREDGECGEGFKAAVPASGDVGTLFGTDAYFDGPGTMRSVVIEPGREEAGGTVGGVSGFGHGDSRGEGGDAWSEGSELTLGRPKSSSIHWKYCRRLLQT